MPTSRLASCRRAALWSRPRARCSSKWARAGRGLQRRLGLRHERVDEAVVAHEPGHHDLLHAGDSGDRAGAGMAFSVPSGLQRVDGVHNVPGRDRSDGCCCASVGFGAGDVFHDCLLPRPEHLVGEDNGDLAARAAAVPARIRAYASGVGGGGARGSGLAAGDTAARAGCDGGCAVAGILRSRHGGGSTRLRDPDPARDWACVARRSPACGWPTSIGAAANSPSTAGPTGSTGCRCRLMLGTRWSGMDCSSPRRARPPRRSIRAAPRCARRTCRRSAPP
jgi:hypothetical protein